MYPQYIVVDQLPISNTGFGGLRFILLDQLASWWGNPTIARSDAKYPISMFWTRTHMTSRLKGVPQILYKPPG